jgi:hypothetical protein
VTQRLDVFTESSKFGLACVISNSRCLDAWFSIKDWPANINSLDKIGYHTFFRVQICNILVEQNSINIT